MLTKLIVKGQRPLQLILSVVGAVAGLFLLMMAFQLYLDFTGILNDPKDDLLSPDFLVINKEVSMLSGSDPDATSFKPSEIAALEALPSIEQAAGFQSNRFPLKAFMEESEYAPPMYTDLFFEAIPNEFIDVSDDEWAWVPEDSIVPIIVPRHYISLYNFGFAPSRGMPRVSESTFKLIRFKLLIGPRGVAVTLTGKIAGFSDRVNSVLVPIDFLEEYNAKFGAGGTSNPNRVILMSNNPGDPELFQLLEDKGYLTNKEKLKSSKLSTVQRMILAVMLVIGGVILVLAVLSFVQYAQLIILQAAYDIQVLVNLGYHHLTISRAFLLFFAMVFSIVVLLSFIALHVGHSYEVELIQSFSFEAEQQIASQTYLLGGAFLFAYLLLAAFNIIRQIIVIAKPKR